MNAIRNTWSALARRVLPARGTVLATGLRALCSIGVLGMMHSASAATTINPGGIFTINDGNTTRVGTLTTWNDTGTLTIHGGGTLQTWPLQNHEVANDAPIVFAGTGGTIALKFNDNDTHFTLNGTITSTATGAQTLAVNTGNNGNGDRAALTFYSGIPNVGDGSPMSLQVTYRTQTGQPSYVSLPGVNTFTGPLTLVKGSAVTSSYLTIGGVFWSNFNGSANTPGTGKLGGGNYPGNISLDTTTILNYLSSANQTLSGAISGAGRLVVGGGGTVTLSGASTFSGNTTVSAGSALVLANGGDYTFYVADGSANKITGGGSATLNGSFTVDTSAVTVTSGSWTLVDVSSKSFGAGFGLAGFTGPVGNVYTKTLGGQSWTFNKATGVLNLSSSAIITSFGIPGAAGVIDQVAKTISLTVPYTPWGLTGLATLAPTFTLTSGTCNPTSGSPPSPTFAVDNPAAYTVTDGGTSNTYRVTVNVTPASSACAILACNFGTLGPAAISGTAAVLTVPPSQSVISLAPTFTLSANATISPGSGTTHNFTSPVSYRVTAENGTTFKDYTVSVQSYEAWAHSGSLFILTTPDGANLPAGVTETNFPLLVRLNSGNFNFGEAQSDGRDLRFTTAAGSSLPYQIEEWNAGAGTASIWVKIPTISGNASQEILMYWGKAGVASESIGSAVFNAANGFVSVFHMSDTLADEVGTTSPANSGTTATTGLIGKGRSFTAGNGVNCGTSITGYPTGSNPHSSQAWIRASIANTNVLGWGIETGQGKVVMQLANPPHMNMDCYFGGANVTGAGTVPLSEWVHVVHTYQSGSAKIYVNGVLDGTNTGGSMNIPTPARMYIGGWYGFNYAGDMDEVRISKVVRSANWVKLEYENQKPLQTLVGSLVPPGSTFSVSPESVNLPEGTGTTLSGEAGGARKVYWVEKKNGVETVLATDVFTLDIAAGRVTGDQNYVIQFKGVYPGGNQTRDIPVTVTDDIPDPVFTLTGPTTWDGRQTIAVTPIISNLSILQEKGVANFNYTWTVNGVAVSKQITPGVLTLTRSQGSGPMTVSLVMDNGGDLVTNSKTITVQEPASDAWVQRTPGATEKPVTKQFFARDPNTGNGTIHYNGTGAGTTPVFLKVYAKPEAGSETLYGEIHRQTPVGGAYAFAVPIAAGKVTYRVEFGTTTGGNDTVSNTVTDLICGDAYLIDGQSNALATDNSAPNDSTTNPWIRTYGLSGTWGYAINKGSEMQLGVWGMILAKRMVTDYHMPVFIIQGAVGGTRIDQHQPNPAGHSQPGGGNVYAIYANIYNRVVGAKLTHGIRGIFWHQGENNSGAAAPTGDWDYKSYQQYFVDMSAAWKQDFPNLQRYIIYQVMPKPCSMGPKGDQLREAQRTLPRLFSKMNILCTLALPGYEGCHFNPAGYQNFADLTAPLVGQDFYGIVPADVVTAPNLRRAWFTTTSRTQIALEFDQDMGWNSYSKVNFYLDKVGGKVTSGSASGKVVKLQLSSAAAATTTLDYLEDDHWSYNESVSTLLYGANTLPALTFADVTIAPPPTPYSLWASDPARGLTAGINDGPLDDPDRDGVVNLMEFTLLGDPLVSSSAILPTVSLPGGGAWVFEYERSNLSDPPATTQVVEYGSDLVNWTPVTIPLTSAGIVTITPGSPSDHVRVSLPNLGAAGFARLRVSE